ncbi:MAG: DNA mismatch repair endonuclease MutL, partial [Mangrovibacterium sp.]
MPDIIQLLPDSVANQIAAGEVIQRPASVVKELVENSIDSGASRITVNIKDAGRTLIQVSDDGCGMSATDARMAFERHATSKIRSATDLFAIRTMGFRGEALASIAAIADVELHTRMHGEEIGTFIHLAGSKLEKQEAELCAPGSNFLVKNLFYNVPARRKFLKGNSTELKHIINEIQRVALANPSVNISLHHNRQPVCELSRGDNIRKRIASLFSRNTGQNLIPVNTETSLIKISGYIGQARTARKTFGEQFFFVNNRFMKHPFFHRAVLQAYEKILTPGSIPSYFLYFEVNPGNIDINIHPTKTEIKFENEPAIWQILQASVRESLGKFNVLPSIDFDQSGSIDIPLPPRSGDPVIPPKIRVNSGYNPFTHKSGEKATAYAETYRQKQTGNWESLYRDSNTEPEQKKLKSNPEGSPESPGRITGTGEDHTEKVCFQFKNKYILAPVKSGLMVIDQKRAHERILYENFLNILGSTVIASQPQLFPQILVLDAADAELLHGVLNDLKALGFDIRDAGKNRFAV